MFYLSLIEHKFNLPPQRLTPPLEDGIKKELELSFLDKVIANLGLCISIYDIRKISGGSISPGIGSPTFTVNFRIIVFRPFEGEILTANLIDSNEDGLRLSLRFFDDIYVPAHHMQKPSFPVSDKATIRGLIGQYKYDVLWKWEYEDDDGGKQSLFISGFDEIKFRVEAVSYPPVPIEPPGKPFAPMVVTGSIDTDGLGPVSWWPDEVEEATGMED